MRALTGRRTGWVEMALSEETTGARQGMRARLDEGLPMLALMGFSCWMVWNSIGFSGAFWLHDIENSLRAENLIVVHLIASAVALVLAAACASRLRKVVTHPAFVVACGLVAAAGTLFIVITRATIYPSRTLFIVGCILSGLGTTGQFLRFAPMVGSLSPRRSLVAIVECSIVASIVFLCMAHLSDEAASCVFVALPLLGAAFMLVRGKESPAEMRVLGDAPRGEHGVRGLALFLVSVAVCSAALELMKGAVLVAVPPSSSAACRIDVDLILAVVFAATFISLHAVRDFDLARLYCGIVAVLVVVLTVVGALAERTLAVAVVASCVCSMFNTVVWAMLAYLSYQAQGEALRYFGLGNAALCLGTIVAGSFVAGLVEGPSDVSLHMIFAALGIVVLVDVLFVFNERRVNELLPPVDDALAADEQSAPAAGQTDSDTRKPGRYMQTCEAMAHTAGLSTRESEVFLALARGWTAQEIAEHESLSIYTVRAHIRSIYAKLGVHSGKELRDLIRDHQAGE